MQTKCTYDKEQFIKKVYYSRVLNKHVGLNKSIGRKIMEKQIIVLVGINMLVGLCVFDSLIKVLVVKNELVSKDF